VVVLQDVMVVVFGRVLQQIVGYAQWWKKVNSYSISLQWKKAAQMIDLDPIGKTGTGVAT